MDFSSNASGISLPGIQFRLSGGRVADLKNAILFQELIHTGDSRCFFGVNK